MATNDKAGNRTKIDFVGKVKNDLKLKFGPMVDEFISDHVCLDNADAADYMIISNVEMACALLFMENPKLEKTSILSFWNHPSQNDIFFVKRGELKNAPLSMYHPCDKTAVLSSFL